jgi:hypothetical protein
MMKYQPVFDEAPAEDLRFNGGTAAKILPASLNGDTPYELVLGRARL